METRIKRELEETLTRIERDPPRILLPYTRDGRGIPRLRPGRATRKERVGSMSGGLLGARGRRGYRPVSRRP